MGPIKFGSSRSCPVLVSQKEGYQLGLVELQKPAAHEVPEEIMKVARVLRDPQSAAMKQREDIF